MAWKVEVTDTFGGEANYSWARRFEMESFEDEARRSIMRRAKALAGWTALPCKTLDQGDSFTVLPRGMCQVMFVTWDDGYRPSEADVAGWAKAARDRENLRAETFAEWVAGGASVSEANAASYRAMDNHLAQTR